MKRTLIIKALCLPALLTILSSCLKGEMDDYDAWREQNDEYVKAIDTKVYTKVVPVWAPLNSVYIRWHNDTTLTRRNLRPLSTSTVNIKYEMENILGEKLGNSYSSTTYGDSIYQSQPNQNIIGMWAALTTMHVGDSVTMIIPYNSAYGSGAQGSVKPYSNLIYHVKMKEIVDYERPND